MSKFIIGFFLTFTGTTFAQPAIVDGPWKKLETGTKVEVWTKQIGGIGGQASLSILKDKKNTTYAVIRQCVAVPGSFAISWSNKSETAFGLDCDGKVRTEAVANWVPSFMPLPY